ncbi:hypothetical protein H072_7264 [Dactylellina haptotyla CBS 200.50]|uniref:Membrane insertase YidC/Oxa/ALB C-terminal domain-containing protein n=1 Tax=Dactylellina haptotyla (strain CBS 200.50) TaxID=1284197 RepID=S8BUG8_DACHA|nr:hypothetical protein H072_7264 [Dactylellina haptotyla CBS 200.50]
MLSRAARRPLQAARFHSPPVGPSEASSGPLLRPRQFSQLSHSPSLRTRTSRWAQSRPSIGLRVASASITSPSSVRFASTDANAAVPASNVELPSNFTSFTEAESHATSIVDRFLPSVPHIVPETVSHAPDTMGYLAALGLDNGWGPTSAMQTVLEAIHVTTGLPWWATVIASTVALRSAFLPIFIRVSDNTARTRELQPLLLPYINRQRAALAAGDLQSQQQIRNELRDIYQRAGVNPLWAFGTFLQIPFQFGSFMILRQMAYLPVPGLETAGAFWFTDLTSADPFFVLPVLSSGFLFLSLSMGAVDLPSNASAGAMKYIRIGLPLVSLAVTCTMPSILTVYFASSSVLSFIQAALLRDERIRSRLGIYRNKTPEVAGPLKQQTLSDSALARIKSDQSVIKQENERRAQESRGGILSAAMGAKGGVGQGVREHLRKNQEAAMHTEYEKRAKEEDEMRKRATGRR